MASRTGRWLAIGAVAAGVPTMLRAAPEPGPRGLPAETNTSDYRVVVEQVSHNRSLSLNFPEMGLTPAPTGGQSVSLNVAVQAPTPAAALGISGFGGPMKAVLAQGGAVNVHAGGDEEGAPVAGRVWRGMMYAESFPVNTEALRELQGELVVYPNARRAKFEWQLPAQLPATRTIPGLEGYKATLREVQTKGKQCTIVLVVERPKAVLVNDRHPDLPYGIGVYTAKGGQLQLHQVDQRPRNTADRVAMEYRLTYAELQDAPGKVQMENLVRWGTPRKISFKFRDVPLPLATAPEGTPLPATPSAGTSTEVWRARTNGATLASRVIRAGAPASEGELSLGLSRQEGDGWSSWRWVVLPTDARGQANLLDLLPGKYRVRRSWRPAPRTPESVRLEAELRKGTWQNSTAEVTIMEKQTANLPPLTWTPER